MNYISKLAVVVTCGWGGLLAIGCSSSSDDAAPVPLTQFPQQFAQAYCAGIKPCCGRAGIPYVETDCKAAATDTFTQYVTEHASAKYDADAAGKCLAAFKKNLDGCLDVNDTTALGCQDVFVGTKALGAECQSRAECASGHCQFEQTDVTAAGMCAAAGVALPPHAKAGEPCSSDCSGDINDGFCFSGTLLPTGSPAGACYESDGLTCAYSGASDVAPTDLASVCVTLPALGEPCPNFRCVKGAFCEEGTCVAQRDSGACQDPDTCSSKSYCDTSLSGGFGGQCTPLKPDGYACQDNTECKNGECAAGTEAHPICGPASVASAESCAGVF